MTSRQVGVGRPRVKGTGQAQIVALWLGTFELLKDESTQGGHVLSNEVLAEATTALLASIDMDEPWIGRHTRLTNQVRGGNGNV